MKILAFEIFLFSWTQKKWGGGKNAKISVLFRTSADLRRRGGGGGENLQFWYYNSPEQKIQGKEKK